MSTENKRPILFEYLDVFKYLQDYYQFRKQNEESFSFQLWSHELGFNSRSYLRMAVLGKKRLTPNFAEKFCSKSLSCEKERRYFRNLVQYSQSGIQAEKKRLGEELILILKSCAERKTITDAIEFMSNPIYARLLTMLGFSDITPVATTFARLLGTDLNEINGALKKLEELKLATSVQVEGENHWTTSHLRFDIPDALGSVPLMKFHEASLNESIAAFHLPKELRRYRSLLLPLSPDEMKEFNQALEEFISQQLARFQANTFESRKLFQVNMNIFPVAGSKDVEATDL